MARTASSPKGKRAKPSSPSPSPRAIRKLRKRQAPTKKEPAKKSAIKKSSQKKKPDDSDGKGHRILINWQHQTEHVYTDKLLTLIEDNPKWKQAFGWSLGDGAGPVKNSGQNLTEHYQAIGKKLLKEDGSKRVHTHASSSLKSKFKELNDELGSTGHGLVEADKEDEIQVDTPMGNVWDKIKCTFPWYKRLYPYLSRNPNVDRSAVSHSGSVVDTSVLHPDDTYVSNESDSDEESGMGGSESEDNTKKSRHHSFDSAHQSGSESELEDDGAVQSKAKKKVVTKKVTAASASQGLPPKKESGVGQPKKRLDAMDKVRLMNKDDHAVRLKVLEKNLKAQREREKIKQDSLTERSRLQIEAEERRRLQDQEHELKMMEKRLELQHLIAQGSSANWGTNSSSPSTSHTPQHDPFANFDGMLGNDLTFPSL
ncbi:hypothetical protein M422DRAFT_54303 [Sphaerobolus stellatus SS14]|uniref:No apical meristem-associated C-terminal domain-containing protein n=1 Tax=Sphaerobolus stellatus (strain SS14) TaxID=990650 RepID=A0A0C9UV41_SPHS4|nr:hypothetical protein M422DRAFT_54303 [Sphaerobolus stellatus SS14]